MSYTKKNTKNSPIKNTNMNTMNTTRTDVRLASITKGITYVTHNEEFIRKIHRPEGVSHRNFNRVGSQYTISFEYNCACGKSSGHKQTKRALNLWVKLHMKKCKKGVVIPYKK